MNTAEQIKPVIERLGAVLDQRDLPPPYDRCGARLLALLTRPVQVVVTGFEGSGKTKLIEMMAARSDIGQAHPLPVFELTYGDTEQALIERADGSVSTFAGLLRDCDIPEDAFLARQELPDPSLINQDFVEVGLCGKYAEKRCALEAAIARADIMIWCSQDFAKEEQELWSAVPDHIKDHSVLAMTKADQQLMRGVLQDNIARLEPIVADEFLGLFPVATIQGIAAQTSAASINERLWSSSGGKTLIEFVARQIRQGRTADIDQANIFLDRLELKKQQKTRCAYERDAAVQGTDTASNQTPETADTDLSSDKKFAPFLSEAVDVLQRHSSRMLDSLEGTEQPNTDMILESCSAAINSVNALFGSAPSGDPVADVLKGDVQEGEEMLMLFQLERGEDAALDAVTLVLQLRKELAEKMVNYAEG